MAYFKSKVIDICENNLVLSVKCDKPSSDGYEVTNLISNNIMEKSRGFLVERFISPPAIITFEFKCSVYIQHIAVDCRVGAQKTSGIEIFSQSKRDSQYTSIGSGVLEDSKYGFVFHRFNENSKNKLSEQYYSRTFRPKSYSHLSSVNRLQIKIFRTSRCSIAAIGKVEIWGAPHKIELLRTNEVKIQNELGNKSVIKDDKLVNTIKTDECARNSLPVPSVLVDNNEQSQFIIPEDFLDPITCEVMVLPVILPSGKIIDKSTLESYEKAEQSWGRVPNDPFTCVPFTSSCKPIFAINLKARLDQYLSANSHINTLKDIPRTVGRPYSKLTTSVSNLIKQPLSKRAMFSNVDNFTSESTAKRQKLLSSTGIDVKACENSSQSRSTFKISKPCSSTTINSENNQNSGKSSGLGLKTTLSSLRKLTADKPGNSNSCNICKSIDNLFSIPCNHFVCRSCLVCERQKTQMKCLLCSFVYTTNDVTKIHLK